MLSLFFQIDLAAQCSESAGADESICFNSLPITLSTPSDTEWQGDFISAAGTFDPNSSGVYEVTLVTSSVGCSDQDSKIITVLASPMVDAGQDQMVCAFDSFQISASASSANGNIVVWSWSGDDQFLSSTNISNPIANPEGSSSFNLTVADEAGCFSFDQINLTSAELPLVSTESDFEICDGPSIISLSGSPSGGTWSGPGSVGNDFISPGLGVHNLEYSYTDGLGCTNTSNLAITVNSVPEVIVDSDFSICENEGDIILSNYSPSNGVWSGEGMLLSSDIFSPNGLTGDKALTYSVGAGTCFSEAALNITVNQAPLVSALSEYDFCQTDEEVILEDFSPAGGHWTGSVINDTSSGTIDANTVSSNNSIRYVYEEPLTGCLDTIFSIVNIKELPSGSFNLESLACADTGLDVINLSSLDYNVNWYLNDQLASTDHSPLLSVSEIGDHSLSAELIDAFGCQTTLAPQMFHIRDIPESNFSVDLEEGCEPLEVTFQNLSLGEEMDYVWEFQVANSISESPGTINFGDISEDTTYEVSLEVSNECGSAMHSLDLISRAKPIASFQTDISSVCSPVYTHFINQSSANSDSFLWNLGDGETSSDDDPSDKVYTTENVSEDFIIELVATNDCGSHSMQSIISVQPNPVSAEISVSALEACAPVEIEFVNSGIGATDIEYNFGEFIVPGGNVNNTFLDPGVYTVFQYATDGCGFDTTSVDIIIFPEPIAQLGLNNDSFCIGEQVQISTIGEELTDYQWQITDGNLSIEESLEIELENSGLFEFNLIATTVLNDCEIQLSEMIEVHPSPVLDFSLSAQEECSPYTLEIINNNSEQLFYNWTLGDFSDSDLSPQFYLTEAGSYSLNVDATNSFGCSTEENFQNTFFLNETPTVDFSFNPLEAHIITSPTVHFQSITEWANLFYWQFGDGDVSFETNPSHVFNEAGIFPVTLVASNDYGCSEEITMGVQIIDEFTIYVPNSFTPNGDGVNDAFKPVVKGTNFFNYKFSVFDRWGMLIYQSNSTTDSWIGNSQDGSHYVSPGVYFWEVTITLKEGQGGKVHSGKVQVIR